MKETSGLQEPVKDEDAAHPIPNVWRPMLQEVIKAFVRGDYALSGGVHAVSPVPADTVEQIRKYIADYGGKLAELPEETWRTSIAQWMGTHWDLLVDLWTVESGKSDMVLSARVFEVENGFRVEIDSVYVP